jgi:hypothetical protein
MKFYKSWKFYAVCIGAFGLIGFGAWLRPGIDLTVEMFSAVVNPPVKVHLSEYDQAVETLWKSEKHQYTCKANAAAFVSLELANKYLNETKKQQLISEYELPESLVKEMAKVK